MPSTASTNELDAPRSWRDVYALVRDTRTDVLAEVGEVKAKVDTHLLAHAQKDGAAAERQRMAGGARSFILTMLPIPASILAVLAVIRSFS